MNVKFDTFNTGKRFTQNYREKKLLKRAEITCKLEIQSIQLVFGQSHQLCLALKAHLASIFLGQGRWKEAEELGLSMIETSKKVLGKEHPFILISMANLALIYRNQGRWKEAEELQMPVIEISKKVLGKEHPDTLTWMANLAIIYGN